MKNTMKLLAVFSTFALLSACATAPDSLIEAREQYKTASEDDTATQYAPVELREAKLALDRAEKEFEDEGNETSTRALAYVAERQARLAMIEGANAKYTAELMDSKEKLLEKTDKARVNAQNAYQRERAIAILTRDQLARERSDLTDAKKKLEAARASGSMTTAQLATMEAKLAQNEKELALAEQQRKELEEQLTKSREKLKEFANVKEESSQMIITLNGSVLFKVGESTLMPIAQNRLNDVAKVLKEQKGKPIVIEGHTDSQGSDEMNRKLSFDRATAVQNYLISQGVDSSKVRAVGLGENQPIADNGTPEGRANNRRVEIVVGEASATTSM